MSNEEDSKLQNVSPKSLGEKKLDGHEQEEYENFERHDQLKRHRLGSRLSVHSWWSELPFVQHQHHYVITSRAIIRASSVIGWNASFMLFAEVILELLMLAGVVPKIPFRLDFFALTTISGILGYQTLVGVAKRELDVTRNSLILAFIVESFLVAGDVEFLVKQNAFQDTANLVLAIRFPFVILTIVNLVLVIWMYVKLHHSFKPDWPVLMDILFLRREVRYRKDPTKPSLEKMRSDRGLPVITDDV